MALVQKMSLCFIDNFRVTIFQLLQRNQRRILFVIHKEFLGKFFRTLSKLYRLHTAILDRPPSSAATMEVQGPDTQ